MEQNHIYNITGIKKDTELYKDDITNESFFGYPTQPLITAENNLKDPKIRSIAYFSMEFGLAPSIYNPFKTTHPLENSNLIKHHEVFSNLRAMDYYHVLPFERMLDLPIYSGGLGVLAGDTLKSAADTATSLAGVGILWNKGYFSQRFWFKYGQVPEETRWDPKTYPGLICLDHKVSITCGKEEIILKLWKYPVYSHDKKHVVPMILLDSNIPENNEKTRQITDQLYRSDNIWWKITQRMALGMGGIKALETLGYSIDKFHLNEGHAALSFIEKKKTFLSKKKNIEDLFSYTCHTPVEAGHDRFSLHELFPLMTKEDIKLIKEYGMDSNHHNIVNLTKLAMTTSSHINGVAQKHGEITRLQFPFFKDKIQSITNGIHTHTWVSKPFADLFDKYSKKIGDWRYDPKLLTNIRDLKKDFSFRKDILHAHLINKKKLAEYFKYWLFKETTFTLCWARRIAPYKRPSMILHNPERLLDIAKRIGPIQIILAGKAHPNDTPAFKFLNEMMEKIDKLEPEKDILKVAFLENYDTNIGKFLTSNVDLWLNNPLPPFEASGTSGMKAILNGVVQLSTLDGWMVEAKDKNIGKIFGYSPATGQIGNENDLKMKEDSEDLYNNLEELVSSFYQIKRKEKNHNSEWVDMMINCCSEAGFFNTQRMVEEYKNKIWKSED